MTIFNFDLANVTHATAFAQICALATQAGVPMQVGTSTTGTQAQASTPTQTPKVYAPAEDVQCKWVQDKCKVTYTLEDGKYVGQTGARKTLNARLREAGATWDASAKAWKFASSKKASDFVANTSALVSASDIEAVRAKAQARADKKANKGA